MLQRSYDALPPAPLNGALSLARYRRDQTRSWYASSTIVTVPKLKSGKAIADHIYRVAPSGKVLGLWVLAALTTRVLDTRLLVESAKRLAHNSSVGTALVDALIENEYIGPRRIADALATWRLRSDNLTVWQWWVEQMAARQLLSIQTPLGSRLVFLMTTGGAKVVNFDTLALQRWAACRVVDIPEADSFQLDHAVETLISTDRYKGLRSDKIARIWHHPSRSPATRERILRSFVMTPTAYETLLVDGPHWDDPSDVDGLANVFLKYGVGYTCAQWSFAHKGKRDHLSAEFRAGVMDILLRMGRSAATDVFAKQRLAATNKLLGTLSRRPGFMDEDVISVMIRSHDARTRQWALLEGMELVHAPKTRGKRA